MSELRTEGTGRRLSAGKEERMRVELSTLSILLDVKHLRGGMETWYTGILRKIYKCV